MAISVSPLQGLYDEFGRPLNPNLNLNLPPTQPVMIPPNIPPVAGNATALPTPINRDDFAPITITPHQPSQIESQRLALQPPSYEDPAFKQGKLRTVLNAIAGGLAGAANPALGVQVGSALHDAPYNRAMVQYKTKAGDLDTKIAQEQERFKAAAEEAKLGSQKGTAISLAGHRNVQDTLKSKEVDIKQQESERKARRDKIYEKYTNWKMNNPKLSDFQFLNSLNEDEYEDAKAVWDDMQKGKRKSIEQMEEEAKAKRMGTIKADLTPEGQRAARTTSEQRATGSTTGRLEAEGTVPLGTTQQAQVDYGVQRAVNDPDSFSKIYKEFKDKRSQAAFVAGVSKQVAATDIPREVTGPQLTVVNNARTALKHIDTIEQLVQDADLAGLIGPIAGRLSMIEQKLGQAVLHDSGQRVTPEGSPARAKEDYLIGELIAMQKYLSVFEASAASGTRPSWQLIKILQDISPNVRMTRDMFEGAAAGARSSALNRLSAIYGKSREGIDMPKDKSGDKKDSGDGFRIKFRGEND